MDCWQSETGLGGGPLSRYLYKSELDAQVLKTALVTAYGCVSVLDFWFVCVNFDFEQCILDAECHVEAGLRMFDGYARNVLN